MGHDLTSNPGKIKEPEASGLKQTRSLKLQSTLDNTSGLHRLERMHENGQLPTGNGAVNRGVPFSTPARGPSLHELQNIENAFASIQPAYRPQIITPPVKDKSLIISSVFENVSFLEHFHLIFRQLGITPNLETPTVLGVTSSVRGEGRTLTALGLAQAMSLQIPLPIVLLEADITKPTLAADLGLLNRGLSEYLRDELSFADLLQSTAMADLSIILAGDAQKDALRLLRSDRLVGLLNLLTQQYAAIIVDMPPLSTLAESTRLMSFLDEVLMVVDANSTPSRLVKAALNVIPVDKRAGVILNRTLTPLGPLKWLRKIFSPMQF